MERIQELNEKRRIINRLLDQEALDAVVLSTQANFAWFTGGADNHVVTASELGVAHIVATRDNAWVVCENIEAPRIENEELSSLNIPVKPFNWWEGGLDRQVEQLIGSANYGSDTGMFGKENIEPTLTPFRFSLLPCEIERYKWVARNTVESINYACHTVEPGMTEHQTAALLNKELIGRGIVPQVTLIAADERITNFRHPIPTDKPIDKAVMIVTGARRWGLCVSMTRIVRFEPLTEELQRKHNACAFVDATFIHNTRPGNSIADVFNRAVQAYAESGYPDEWKLHHQGGLTGYKGREFRGTPSSKELVMPNQAYAWNPSITGTKAEDTIIVLPEGNEIISDIPDWPMIEIDIDGEIIRRPDVLVR